MTCSSSVVSTPLTLGVLIASVASGSLVAPRSTRAQDSTDARRAHLGVLPVIGSAPETGLQYGATVFRVYRAGSSAETRPSVDQVSASNTAKGQRKASIQTERWSDRNRWRLRARLEYQDYPLPFFGIGPATPADAEERYRAKGAALHVQLHRRLRPATYVVSGFRFAHTSIGELETGGALASGTVMGSDGGDVSQLQGGVVRDSRDNIFSPRSGTFAQGMVSVARSALGSDFDFTRTDVDVRRYVPIGRLVLAGQLQYSAATGSTPFDQLPAIGADSAIRGYTRGRFRDRQLISGQAELRTGTWRRIGLVAFAGTGAIAPTASDLSGATWQPSVGAGLRYILFPRDRTAIRVDFGKGRGSSGLYIGLNEAF